MTPHRLTNGDRPHWVYLKVALIGAILSILVTLANNERTDQKVRTVARAAAESRVELVNYSVNRSVCGFRKIADDTIARSRTALSDKTASPSTKDRNRQAIKDAIAFKDTQIPIPADFDCKTLPKTPPD